MHNLQLEVKKLILREEDWLNILIKFFNDKKSGEIIQIPINKATKTI